MLRRIAVRRRRRDGSTMTITTADETALSMDDVPLDHLAGDFYHFQDLLTDREREQAGLVREYFETEVRPIADGYWARAEFPKQVIPELARLGLLGAFVPEVRLFPNSACGGRSRSGPAPRPRTLLGERLNDVV